MKHINTNSTDSLWFACLGGLAFVFLVTLFAASTSTACGYMADVPQPTQKLLATLFAEALIIANVHNIDMTNNLFIILLINYLSFLQILYLLCLLSYYLT